MLEQREQGKQNFLCVQCHFILALLLLRHCQWPSSQAQEDAVAQAMSRIKYEVSPEKAASSNCDLVVEAIVESVPIKQDLFSRLDKVAPRQVGRFCRNVC